MPGFPSSLVGTVQFASVAFLFVLAITVIAYYSLPGPRTRAVLLLVVSSLLYLTMAPQGFLVLALVTTVAYVSGVLIERGDDRIGRTRSVVGVVAVVALVAGLALFKYADSTVAFVGRIAALSSLAGDRTLRLVLPLGMSFWTFQAIAYVVDVRKGRTSAERDPLLFWLSVAYFPIVTAGPITKIQQLGPQLREKRAFDPDGIRSGLLLMGRGFFKKLMVADRLVVFVDAVYADPHAFGGGSNGLILFVASCFFAIQLYMDFSGYSDIVRGASRLFGVEIPNNFRGPYFATTVRDFWRRWHISLMDWLKEYVYIPLGGNRVGDARRYANLLAVFAVSGLWHGTGLTYLAWGLLNGIYQVAGGLLAPLNERIIRRLRIDRDSVGHRAFRTARTFVLITVSWVFFRAESLADGAYIVTRMFSPTLGVLTDGSLLELGLTASDLAVALLSAVIVFILEWASLRTDALTIITRRRVMVRWAVYYALILTIVLFGAYGGAYRAADFVYFKF